jgi:hypothetical protein
MPTAVERFLRPGVTRGSDGSGPRVFNAGYWKYHCSDVKRGRTNIASKPGRGAV